MDNFSKFHRQSVVVDTHCDTVHKFSDPEYDFSCINKNSHIDLPRLQTGGINVQFFALYIEPQYKPVGALHRTLQLANHFYKEIEKNDENIRIALNAEQIDTVIKDGKIAAVLSIEGGEALEGDIDVLSILFRLGVRSIGLTWNQRNQIADGVGELEAGGGLTNFGRQVIREMNKLGMLIDLAHITPKGFYDVLETSNAPVIVSHGNCKGVCDNRRNYDDNQLKALSDKDGVIGLTFCPSFVSSEEENQTLDKLVEHAVYAADKIGAEYIGIGSDFDGIQTSVKGLDDASYFPNLTEALLKKGFSAAEIRGILGENYLRIFRQVWK